MVTDFGKRVEMAVENTFQKEGGTCVIYKAAGRKEIENYKVVSGENVATQHQILVCWMSMERKQVNDEARIN